MRLLLNVHELAQRLSGLLDNAKSKRGTIDVFQLSPTGDGNGVVAIRQYTTTKGRVKTVRVPIASSEDVIEPLDRPFEIPMHYLTGWLSQADGDVEQIRVYADTDKLRGSLEYETADGGSGVVKLRLYEVKEGKGLPTEEPDTVCDPRELASMDAYTSGDPKRPAMGFVLLSSGLAIATDGYCAKYRPVKSEYDGLVTLDGHPATDCDAKFPNVLSVMPFDIDLGKGVRLSKSIAPVLKRWLAGVHKVNDKRHEDEDYAAYVRLEVTDGQLDVRCPTAMARNVYQIAQDAESEGYVVNFGIRQLLRLMADPDMGKEFVLASTGSRGRSSAVIQRNATWLQATYTVRCDERF